MRFYNLLIVTGTSPGVITTTIYDLLREDWVPATIQVLTTRIGENYIRATLFDETGLRDENKEEITNCDTRWANFREQVSADKRWPHLKGHVSNIPFDPNADIEVIKDEKGTPINDINDLEKDRAFADACSRHVINLVADPDRPLVAAIAGGRKTMGAHLQNFLSLYGRTGTIEDRLLHVLVPKAEEEGLMFFWPGDESYTQDWPIHRIEIFYPPLRYLLRDRLGVDPDAPGILDAIRSSVRNTRRRTQEADYVVVHLWRNKGELRFYDEDDVEIIEQRVPDMKMRPISTLLILADLQAKIREERPGTCEIPLRCLTEKATHTKRIWFAGLDDKSYNSWAKGDASGKISHANNQWKEAIKMVHHSGHPYGASKQGAGYRFTFPEIRGVYVEEDFIMNKGWPLNYIMRLN